jgi:hypothetical protein
MMDNQEETHLNLDVLVEFSQTDSGEYSNQIRVFSHGFTKDVDKPFYEQYIKPAYFNALEKSCTTGFNAFAS